MSAASQVKTGYHHGIRTWDVRADYKGYKSPYGPQYKIQPNFHGIDLRLATRYAMTAAGFGGVAGIFALFFFAEIPRVREDVMKKVPFLSSFFDKQIAPEDNPF